MLTSSRTRRVLPPAGFIMLLVLSAGSLFGGRAWTSGEGPALLRPPADLGFNREAEAARAFFSGTRLLSTQELSHRVALLLIEFQPDTDTLTTGNGTFGDLPFYHPHPDPDLRDQGYVVRDPDINSRSKFYYAKHMQWASEYYEASSGGSFGFEPVDTLTDVSSIVRLPEVMGTYGDNEEFAVNMVTFMQDAVLSVDTLTAFDFSGYDAFLIFHAGAGEEADFGPPPLYEGDSPRDLHSAYIPFEALRQYLADGDPSFRGIPTTGAGGDTTFVRNALVLPETLIQDSLYNPSAVYLDILGIIVHEYGHHLGLPDLYDPAHVTRPAVGNFGLMGTGAYNSSARLPSQPIGWSKYYLGWLDALEVASDMQGVELFAVGGPGTGNRLLKVPVSSSEYFLLENRIRDRDFDGEFRFDDADGDNWPDLATDDYRLPDGSYTEFDFALPGIITYPDNPLPGSGVLIWHIDNEVIRSAFDPNFNENCVNCNISRQGVDLEEADGVQHLDREYPLTIDPGYGSPFDSYGGAVDSVKEASLGNLNTLLGPSSIPSSTSNLGISSNITLSGFRSATIDPERSLVDSIVSIDVSFEERLAGFPVMLRPEEPLDFETDPLVFGLSATAVTDLDGDGASEIIVLTREGELFLVGSNGTMYPGGGTEVTAYASTGETVVVSPAAGDTDGDGEAEIAIVDSLGVLSLYSTSGPAGGDVLEPGFPVTLPEGDYLPPACYDVDGDGADEIILVSSTGGDTRVDVRDGGGSTDGWPVEIEGSTVAGAAVYPLPAGPGSPGGADLIVALSEGTVVRLSGSGEELWRRSVGSGIELTPVLADLDRDGDKDGDGIAEEQGDLEIAVVTTDGSVTIIHSDGRPLPGGSQPTGGEVISQAAAADVNMDGYVELLVTVEETRDLIAYRLNDSGTALNRLDHFPKHISAQTLGGSKPYFSSIVTADIDGEESNGRMGEEIIFGTKDNVILVFDASSTSTPRKKYPLGGDAVSSPSVADVDGDGTLDIVTTDDRGYLYAWSTDMAAGEARVSWPQFGGSAGRSFANTLPLLDASRQETPVFSEERTYVYPNPFNPERQSDARIHLEVSEEFLNVDTIIYDVSGRKIRRTTLFPDDQAKGADIFDQPIEIDDLASGVYILAVELRTAAGESKRLFEKFAVIR